MNTIPLNGADAHEVAKQMGGTLILWDITNDKAMIAGGDVELLEVAEVAA